MQKLLPLALFGLIAAVFTLPAASADLQDRDRGKAGTGASTEGGASLGGTGIDSGISNQRGTNDSDKRIILQRKPRPVEERKEPAEPKPPADKSGASSGATRHRGDLSEEADKQDEEFRRKQDALRHK